MPSVPRPIRPPVHCSSERRPKDAARSGPADAVGSDEMTQCDTVEAASEADRRSGANAVQR
jgi:hypothetical protein